MNTVVGNCGKCGAPYTAPSVWGDVGPVPFTPSCACWSGIQTVTGNSCVISSVPMVERWRLEEAQSQIAMLERKVAELSQCKCSSVVYHEERCPQYRKG